ncbi:ABC transporter substrate-binding protein [Kosakonia radicincitans]|uniref:ABC transporter substrate-binding protein n=1 Tax=Kosakonia radicincitans TaxID=283686 RepID=UPI000903535C|nr:ABC transporter substrate-binding protein [Kosakonia radicincitans]APG17693.1 amino acid ABC transporter [Kosakonia radicincitans]QEM92034.1 ABC transporter substrate-binding protein [Kosakonia radicincitans]
MKNRFGQGMTLSTLAGMTLLGLAHTAQADVNIGAILPLTGTSASIGEDQRRGMELAVEQVNAQGGVNGQPLHVIVEDSAESPVTGLNAVRKLTQVNHVPLVMGSFSSSVTIPIGQYLVKNNLLHINISGTSTDIRKIGATSWSVIGLDSLSASFSAQDVRQLGYSKVAFIAPDGAYGQGMAEQFSKAFEKEGGKVVAKVLYTSGQPSYRRELEQISRAHPQAYVYTSYGQDAIVLNREAWELGLNKTPWYGMYLTMAIEGSPAQYTNGQVGMEVAGIDQKAASGNGANYAELYQQKFHERPRSVYGSYAWDSVMLAAAAINKAHSADPAAMIAAMKTVAPGFTGITGTLNLDADNQRQSQPYLKVKAFNGVPVPR